MAATQTGVAAAGKFEVCYVTKGYGVKASQYENRVYETERQATDAARKSLVEGLEPARGKGGLSHVDEAHMRAGDGEWRLVASLEQPKHRSALSVGAEYFLPALRS